MRLSNNIYNVNYIIKDVNCQHYKCKQIKFTARRRRRQNRTKTALFRDGTPTFFIKKRAKTNVDNVEKQCVKITYTTV